MQTVLPRALPRNVLPQQREQLVAVVGRQLAGPPLAQQKQSVKEPDRANVLVKPYPRPNLQVANFVHGDPA